MTQQPLFLRPELELLKPSGLAVLANYYHISTKGKSKKQLIDQIWLKMKPEGFNDAQLTSNNDTSIIDRDGNEVPVSCRVKLLHELNKNKE